MQRSINVLMLTHNSEKWLKDVLPPLQDSRVRLIVVDGSTDNTVEIVLKYFPDAIIIKDKSNNLAYLRNLALRESEKHPCEYTAFIDSDMVMPSNFFERTVEVLESSEKIGAVYVGGILNFEPKTFTAKFWRNLPEPQGLYEKDSLCTTSTLFKTDVVKGIVIDERCKRGNEDAYLALKIRERGFKIMFDNNPPFAIHLRPATVMEELKRYVNFGKTKPLVLFQENNKKLILRTVFVDIFAIGSLASFFFIPLFGWVCFIPFIIYFIRHMMKLQRKWRVDHVLFSMLLSYLYNTSCFVSMFGAWLKREKF
jgi:glycosyltransferase involved in cell wall biosynthesis